MTEEQYYEKGFELHDILVNDMLTGIYAGLPRNGSVFKINDLDKGMAYVFYNPHNRRWYLLEAALGKHLLTQKFVSGLYQAHLFHGIEQNGSEFIAVVTLGGEKTDMLMEVMEDAKNSWYKRSDVNNQLIFSKNPLQGRSDNYKLSFEETMKQAFRERYIASPDYNGPRNLDKSLD